MNLNYRFLTAILYMLAVFVLSTLSQVTYSQSPEITNGLTYLQSTQNTDGSWGGTTTSLNGEFPTTAVVVQALKQLESTPSTNQLNGIQFLKDQSIEVTPFLAARILALAETREDITSDVNALLAIQNDFDGGWGTAEGFGSSVLDSALTLQAFSAAGLTDISVLIPALGYLNRAKVSLEGWGLLAREKSRVFFTAHALLAFNGYRSQFNVSAIQQSGINWMRGCQNADGGYGHPASTAFETALALLSIFDSGMPLTAAETEAIQFLIDQQQPNGSWVDDAYSTALALLALAFPIDTDGDGMSDAFETTNMLDPNDPTDSFGDLDSDGLTNLEEFQLGTNPKLVDSDGDGVDDQTELFSGSDPADANSTNRPPEISSEPVATAREGELYSYQVSASDPDGDALSYAFLQAPAGMTISTGGLIEWTPAVDQTGIATVIMEVSDGQGGNALQQYRLTALAIGVDLTVANVDVSGVTSNTQTLVIGGNVGVDVSNNGASTFEGSFQVLVFEDGNMDGTYNEGEDTSLGVQTFSGTIASEATTSLTVPVSGIVLFHENLTYAFVDSADQIVELDETNNLGNSGERSRYQPAETDFLPVVEWEFDPGLVQTGAGVNHAPTVAPLIDTNGDGLVNEKDVPAVLFVMDRLSPGFGGPLVALRGDTGEEIFRADDLGTNLQSASTPTVADIDGDGIPEILIRNYNTFTFSCINNDGSLRWTSASATWASNAMTVADLDGDGKSEIAFGEWILNFDGTRRWQIPQGGSVFGGPQLFGTRQFADLDLDGDLELVSGAHVVDSDGNLMWRWTSSRSPGQLYTVQGELDGGATTTTITTDKGFFRPWCAVANIDDEPFPEVIVISHQGSDTSGDPVFNDTMWIFDHDGRVHAGPFGLFQESYSDGGSTQETFLSGAPTIADFDGDGRPEIAIPVDKTTRILDESGTRTLTNPDDPDRTIIFVFRGDGTLVWQKDLNLGAAQNFSQHPSAISSFDFDGNGSFELVYKDEQEIFILDGQNGEIIFRLGIGNTRFDWPSVFPTIADVDNDGNAEIVVGTVVTFPIGSPQRGGVLVIGDASDNWIHSRRIWNQWQYSITHVEESGNIPTEPINNWDFYNNQRAQSPIEGVHPFAAPDLTVSKITINQDNCPSGTGITARIGNGGSVQVGFGVNVNFYSGDPDTGGVLIGNAQTTESIFPGEFEDVTINWNSPENTEIYVTVNETVTGPTIPSDNLSLLSNTWAESSGICVGCVYKSNGFAYRGIDGMATTLWQETINNAEVYNGSSFFQVRFLFPVNVDGVTIENNTTLNIGFLEGTIELSNGFIVPISMDANGEGTVTFPEQADVSWVRLNGTMTKEDGASLSEFVISGSYVEPIPIINEGEGRFGNNKAVFGAGASQPCDTTQNLSPQITSAPPITAEPEILYSYQVEASDPNADPLTFLLVSGPSGMTIGNTTGLVNWTPSDLQIGDFSVTVEVSDGQGETEQQAFVINVALPQGTNRPPVIVSAPNTLGTVGESYVYDVEANDPDGDVILFSLLQAPAGATIDVFSGLISWTPGGSQIGTQFFTVLAQDGRGGNAQQSFSVIAEAVLNPLPPEPVDNDDDGFDETVDCLDSNPDVNPGQTEIPNNGLDDDCNPATPDTLPADSVACSIVTDKINYSPNSVAQLSVRLENTDLIVSMVGLELAIAVLDPNGSQVFFSTLQANTLAPGALYDATIQFPIELRPAGSYEAVVDVLFDGVSQCQDSAVFGILTSTVAGNSLTGSIAADPGELDQGGTVTLNYDVTNAGNENLADVALRVVVVNIADESIIQDVTDDPISLIQGASAANSKDFSTLGVPEGDYLAILLRESTDNTETVDSAFLKVINIVPVANAGPDQDVDIGKVVNLDGGNSADAGGDAIGYAWSFDTIPTASALTDADIQDSTTPNPTFIPDVSGLYILQLTVNDGQTDSAPDLVNVDAVITPNDDTADTLEDVEVDIDVLANDTELVGDYLTVTAVGPATNGIVESNPDNTIAYTPGLNFNGIASFDYTVTDAGGSTATATVTVNISPVNDAPVAVDDSDNVDEGLSTTTVVMSNDNDVDNLDTELIVTIISAPSLGSATVKADGSVTYQHNGSETTSDSYTYQVCDPDLLCASATVTLAVNPVNDAPVAGNDAANVDEGAAVTTTVLENDSDADNLNNELTVSVIALPDNGTATVEADSTITYQHNDSETTADTYTYQICDPGNLCASANVTVTVNPVNDAPVALDDVANVDEGATVTTTVLDNDSDADNLNTELIVTVTGPPANGTATVEADGSVSYQHNGSETTADIYTYQICDPENLCASATVTLTVNPVNDAPVAVDDTATTDEDVAVIIPVVDNDSDAEGGLDLSSVTIVTQPEDGTVSVNSVSGAITYSPNPDINGNDMLEYQLCDSGADGDASTDADDLCTNAVVTITIQAVNDPPVANNDTAITTEDAPVTLDVKANDSGGPADEDQTLTISEVSDPGSGVAVINPDGTITYTPDAQFNILDTFSYTVCDSGGLCDSAVVTITVEDVPPGSEISVSKNASHLFAYNGQVVEFSVTVVSHCVSTDPLTITSIFDNVYGEILDTSNPEIVSTDCVSATIDPGESYTCTFEIIIPETGMGELTDTVTVIATDDEGNLTSASDTATVILVPVTSTISSGLCHFDRDGDPDNGRQFRLIFTPDIQIWPAYKVTASNPGQFFYNLFYIGSDFATTFNISLPYPFVTQGAMPVHVYSRVTVTEVDGSVCFIPDPESEVYAGDQQIILSDYDGGYGSTATLNLLDIPVPETGFMYVAVHLDYGLKGSTGYGKNSVDDAVDFTTEEILIPNFFNHEFSVNGSLLDSQVIQNTNAFKRIPGFAGIVTDLDGTPIESVQVDIYRPGTVVGVDSPLGSLTTDEDGWYMFEYKHKGKPADYSVTLPAFGLVKEVRVKGNAFVETNFIVE